MVLIYVGEYTEVYPKYDLTVYKGWVEEVSDELGEVLLSTKKFVVLKDKHLYEKEILKGEDFGQTPQIEKQN